MKKISGFENYDHAVEYFAQNSIDSQFDNEGPEHAATVLTQMLKHSNEMRIFSGTFNSEVTNKTYFMKELDKFINEKKELYLILEQLPEKEKQSSALKKVIEYSKTGAYNVQYKIANPKFIEKLENSFTSNRALHFAIGDDQSFRVETDFENYKARCNFNDKVISGKLKNIFDTYFFDK